MNAKTQHLPAADPVPAGQQLAITPMAMLEIAVKQGADLDRLQKLMDLQERWEANEARKAFVGAIAAFKKNPPVLSKNKHVKFGQGDRITEYDHATLDKVCDIVGRALSLHGLSHRWEVDQKEPVIAVTCVLTHVAGHSERVQMQATADTSGSKNSIQAIGSTVTYLQRYTLLAATGLAAKGQDDDGIGAGVMDEGARLDFEAAIDSAADAAGLEAIWKEAVVACKKTPKDMDSYNRLKARVAAKGKALKGKK